MIILTAWGLLGPRRRSDESGHHVELARHTRERDERDDTPSSDPDHSA